MIFIDNNSGVPIYQQIYRQIKNEILQGTISAGSRLLPIRQLAAQLCVARNTVENAYGQLAVEGYVEARRGSGYVVQDIDEFIFRPQKEKQIETAICITDKKQPDYDFQYNNIDTAFFPQDRWRQCMRDVINSDYGSRMGMYGDRQGEWRLRMEIRKYIHSHRGVQCSADQIIICCGLQHSLSMLCRILPQEYHKLGFEEPGYDVARAVFENEGFDITPMPIANSNDYLAILKKSNLSLLYITPSNQFPTGYIMPVAMRYRLLEWARQNDGYIIEDDYGSELQYHLRPVPSLCSIDKEQRVIYIGTFSKSLSPALRISYMVLPVGLLPLYHREKGTYTYPVNSLTDQIILTAFMENGHWERHIRKVRKIAQRRRDCMLQRLNNQFGDKVSTHGTNSGLHILVNFHYGIPADVLIDKAAKEGIVLYSVDRFYIQQDNIPVNTVIMGFGSMSEKDIAAGIEKLKKVIENMV